MTIIIGLGNPGKKFEKTRHNVGFLILDKFMEKNNFPDFKFSEKFNSFLSENILNNEKIILMKPQTFMNDSGKAVKSLVFGIKDQASILIVVHDDIDLPVGKIKIVEERGSAGHRGVESIIKNIGNKNLVRIRIGISPQKEINARQIVLKNFSKKEQGAINDINKKTVEVLEFLLQ
ncbi:MAG: aminoacyl-tRNA hydrolase, partial [Candidatus Staskawiczbacteria bacterium]|nr:aminoacyl-tRNA hydrolase [Candidatus Staskawiczbacteria bacterium]